jgi:hypothetical protein
MSESLEDEYEKDRKKAQVKGYEERKEVVVKREREEMRETNQLTEVY